ncbi:NAD(P)-binding domain-containing protein [Saccharopolyspora sp. K220]|uniref:NAD(P)-dependent oxidoreductase n=1 Tax=Saccharopolyspora soli TaxID=2926618 RepID=UPI001F578D4E|nr:NAD(P)-binding domain-containing protein [Saccharopolyspora soli]MCI2418482.1 NAD(P)-binding domain-containing protein [Saccharopolyspora soli]
MNQPVTLIGLGPMGQAMVDALLTGGHPVTVWNRTASRADGVVARGAVRAATPAEAVRASELVILSLTDYQAMHDILGPVEDLSGRVIVNLSSDTPEQTREAAKWAAQRGAEFITGGVMVPAPLVGQESAYVFYSGPRETFEAHAKTLRLIGKPNYVGADPGMAQLYYQAQLDIFLTSLSAFLHATALVGSAGVSAQEFLPWAVDNFNMIAHYLPQAAQQIDNDEHPGDLSTATMMGATAAHILAASQTAGIDVELPRAIKAHYDRAIAAGRGADNWTRLIDGIREPR